jgi:endonuclease YncB( thermonuclease family)
MDPDSLVPEEAEGVGDVRSRHGPRSRRSMAKHTLKNSGGVPFLTLKGFFVVREKQMPDGDTIAFCASKKYSKGPVETNVPVNTTGIKTTNIRLQSIDAPEKSQPFGAKSRDALLAYLGFDPAELGLGNDDFTAGGPTKKVAGWIATHGLDGNKRPLGYVFKDNPGFKHGGLESAAAIKAVLKSSGNYKQVSGGWAFPAFYENTDETHAVVFQVAAQTARASGKKIWSADKTTTGFVPTKTALGSAGTLVYPKFYRRVEKWKAAKPNASAFINWLKTQADGKKPVQGAEPNPIKLWELFEKASSSKVRVPYDVSRLWFSE